MGLTLEWLLQCDRDDCSVTAKVLRSGGALLEKVIAHTVIRRDIKAQGWVVTEAGRTICPTCVAATPDLGRPDSRQLAKKDYRQWLKRVDPERLYRGGNR